MILQSIQYPSEIISMCKMRSKSYKIPFEKNTNDIDACYEMLNRVSRSFSVVIQQLPDQLKDVVCIFYLVLRGLDSIEDDIDYDIDKKIILLKEFYKKLDDPTWSISAGDTPDYKILLQHFYKVIRCYKALDKKYKIIISDMTQQMGNGMSDFARMLEKRQKEKRGIDTMEHYNLYCHYVAGLVGQGLSDLWVASGLEDAFDTELSSSMGIFLQKVNIIRDYLEDNETRSWWPEEVWSKHSSSLSYFKDNPESTKSLDCLNELVVDALTHVPDTLKYVKKIKNPQIFKFCAIPQIMAIATLYEVYNNPNVFKKNVKVRKGFICKIMTEPVNIDVYYSIYAQKFLKKDTNDTLSKICHEMNTLHISETNLYIMHQLAWMIIIFSIYSIFTNKIKYFLIFTIIAVMYLTGIIGIQYF